MDSPTSTSSSSSDSSYEVLNDEDRRDTRRESETHDERWVRYVGALLTLWKLRKLFGHLGQYLQKYKTLGVDKKKGKKVKDNKDKNVNGKK